MKKSVIILLHLLLSSFGALEYCLTRGLKKLRLTAGYHYSSRIGYQHPASSDIVISITEKRQEPFITSYLLCNDVVSSSPQCLTLTLSLN